MSKKQLLILIGIWIIIYLFLGFPSTWDKIFSVAVGLLIIVIAFKSKSTNTSNTAEPVPYIEHKNTSKPFTTSLSSDSEVQSNSSVITNPDSTHTS